MPEIRTLVLLAVGVGIISLLFAVYQQSSSQVYCYSSIKTLDSDRPNAGCFVVTAAGTFEKIGTREEVSKHSIPVDGHVLPGLWDGHGHLLQYGEMLQSVNLFGSRSLNDARTRIREYIERNPNEGNEEIWIRGIGWDQAAFSGTMPTADDLESDDMLKGKYIMLDRVDVHCIWVSQAVLNLLPDPVPSIPGGEIITEPGRGVFCDNSMDFVLQYWPGHSREKKLQFVKNGMKELNKYGLVGMHDAGASPETLSIFKEAVLSDEWTVRVYSMIECQIRNTFCPEDAFKYRQEDGKLTIGSVKLFGDGALGSWGSAMIEPYDDHSWTSGSLLVNGTELTKLAKEWSSVGFQVNIHAIGDLANRLAIDALIAGLEQVCENRDLAACQSERRFRIEHSQIIHPDDQARMHKVGIIPSIQPTHATSDMYYAETRLGKVRTETEAYRMKSLLPLQPILGSDFPVEPPDPFKGIFAAIARRDPHTGLSRNGTKEGWYMSQALSLEEALKGFTLGPAHGAFLEGKAGVIKEGAFADWIVLDAPIEELDAEGIRTLQVRETWVAGKRVYQRS